MALASSVAQIRSSTLKVAARLGYSTNPGLPLLDRAVCTRAQNEVAARTLCLFAASACAFGFSHELAERWINAEGFRESLTSTERDLVLGRRRATLDDRYQVEGIWALLWALSVTPSLDFGQPCPNTTVSLLPDLRVAEPTAKFKSACRLRESEEILPALDLAYMIHWSVVNESLHGRQTNHALSSFAVRHRRRALEWLCCTDSWDQIELDT